jgi:hypothetical protein
MNKILFIILILLIIYYYFNINKENFQSVGNFDIIKYPVINNKDDALNSLCKLDESFLTQNYELCKNIIIKNQSISYEDIQIPKEEVNENQFQSVSSSEGFEIDISSSEENEKNYLIDSNKYLNSYICDETTGKKIINNKITDLDCDVDCGEIINKKIYDKCNELGVYVEENQFKYRNKGKGIMCQETYDIYSCGEYLRGIENDFCIIDNDCIYGLKCDNKVCIKDKNNDNFKKLSFLCSENNTNCIDSYSVKNYKLDNKKEFIIGKSVMLITKKYSGLNIREIEIYDEFNRLISNNQNIKSSSVVDNNIAENSIDRDDNTFTQTEDNINEWILIEFKEQQNISKIIIKNRKDCCKDKILKTSILIFNDSNLSNISWFNTIYEVKDEYIFETNINTIEKNPEGYNIFVNKTTNNNLFCEEIKDFVKPEILSEKCNLINNCNSFFVYTEKESNKTICCYKNILKDETLITSNDQGILYLKNN